MDSVEVVDWAGLVGVERAGVVLWSCARAASLARSCSLSIARSSRRAVVWSRIVFEASMSASIRIMVMSPATSIHAMTKMRCWVGATSVSAKVARGTSIIMSMPLAMRMRLRLSGWQM